MAPHVKSKRQTLRHKYKVEKKAREHRRKVRRASKARLSGPAPKCKRKDPGIPNLWPFKQELMEDIERRRVEARESRLAARASAGGQATGDLDVLANDAARRSDAFEDAEVAAAAQTSGKMTSIDYSQEGLGDGSRKAFMKEFRRVVESADVLLEVLDARDPIGCRCYDAERAVIAASGGTKRVVLVLNKVDLVPREVVERWLTYLRNELPTVAFRASIQAGSGNVGQANITPLSAAEVGTTDCLGASTLLSLLKNYSRSRNIKTSITVGVIGYPNVGKSSLINSLKRSHAVSTGAMPGVTRSAQEVHLDKNIRLLDCPGIVFSTQQTSALILRNCVKIEDIADPVSPVELILKRIGREPLMEAYSLPSFSDVIELLAILAKVRGKYKRGGVLDVCAAAVIILKDWNGGKIPFYTLPPKGPRWAHLSASVVKEWGEEFKVDKKLLMAESSALSALGVNASEFAVLPALDEEDVDFEDEENSGSSGGEMACDAEEDAPGRSSSDRNAEGDDEQPTFHTVSSRKVREMET